LNRRGAEARRRARNLRAPARLCASAVKNDSVRRQSGPQTPAVPSAEWVMQKCGVKPGTVTQGRELRGREVTCLFDATTRAPRCAVRRAPRRRDGDEMTWT
jgi:hypothetical protein